MKISRALYDEIVAHAVEDRPNECCGLVATEDGVAKQVYRVQNSYKYPSAGYEMKGEALINILDQIEDAGLSLGAMYHSHPRTAAKPSQTDINTAVPPKLGEPLWPGTLYIIVGFPDGQDEPDVRGFRIDGDGVAEVALSVQ
jgi:[CysO sulfur-carrier protein]-S-L-cysteine hydrolase